MEMNALSFRCQDQLLESRCKEDIWKEDSIVVGKAASHVTTFF